ncbi:thiol-disulfide isomerase/thioredoxin [Oxalobacteraceae bacterium GrIS 1.11]
MQKRAFLQTAAALSMGLCAPALWSANATRAPAPPLAFNLDGKDSNGKPVKLDDYPGKVCLVSFFAFDCESCFEDLRLMREFYLANKDKNFVILGVNIDKRKEMYLEYMSLIEKTIPVGQRFPIVWRNAPGHSDSFGPITTTPTHFVLNRVHKQVLRRDGGFQASDWDDLWTSLT